MVSVPCRGAMFLNSLLINRYVCMNIVSVPCRGAMFLNSPTRGGQEEKKWFPSPVGELCFSIIESISQLESIIVSVPCRGAMFLNP